MSLFVAVLLFLAGGEDAVRLELRGGKTVEGSLLALDDEGNYVVRTAQGARERIPYRDVLNVVAASGTEPEASVDVPAWPEFPRPSELTAVVVRDLGSLPESKDTEAVRRFARAVEAVRGGEMRSAAQELNETVNADPVWAGPRVLRAAVLAELGVLGHAYDDIAIARASGGVPAAADDIAAEICYLRGLTALGDAAYAEALARRCEGAEREWRLGHFWRGRNEEKARAHFAAYLAADPELALPFSVEGALRARMRAERDARRFDRAALYARRLQEGSPYVAAHFRLELVELLKQRAAGLAREGAVNAALADFGECAELVPEERAALERAGTALAVGALRESLAQARTRAQIVVIDEQLERIQTPPTPDIVGALRAAYVRACREALARNDVADACACLEAVQRREMGRADVAEAVKPLAAAASGVGAEDARLLAKTIARICPEYLSAEGSFLSATLIEEARRNLREGARGTARRELTDIARLFGETPAVAQLSAEIDKAEAATPAARAAPGEATEAAAEDETRLLGYFPLETGRWWDYASKDGQRELWRIAALEHVQGVLRAEFTGTLTDAKGTFPCRKEIFFNGKDVYAHAPTAADGGRLLLWTPIRAGGEGRVFRNANQVRERSYAALSEKVRCGERNFADCLHVVVRNALVGNDQALPAFSLASHYWYAPDIGLVRIEAEGGEVWELTAWGKGEPPKREPGPAPAPAPAH